MILKLHGNKLTIWGNYLSVDITSAFSGNSSIQRLVDLYLQRETGPRNAKIRDRESVQAKRSKLSDLQSKLSALSSKSDTLSDTVFDVFSTKKASSSDIEKISATAGDTALGGNHSLVVS